MGLGIGVLALGLSLLAPTTPAEPAMPVQSCAPAQLTRLSVRNVTPGLAAADPRAQPQTIWRKGVTFLRKEDAPDPSRGGAASLVIIAEPDVWTINLATGEGRHAVDPGPVFEAHAPILPLAPDLPPQLQALEFGCEAAFVAALAPEASQTARWGSSNAGAHLVTVGDHSVALLMDTATSQPLLISYSKGDRPVLVIRYDDHRTGLPDQPDLFVPDKGLKIQEAKPPPRGLPKSRS